MASTASSTARTVLALGAVASVTTRGPLVEASANTVYLTAGNWVSSGVRTTSASTRRVSTSMAGPMPLRFRNGFWPAAVTLSGGSSSTLDLALYEIGTMVKTYQASAALRSRPKMTKYQRRRMPVNKSRRYTGLSPGTADSVRYPRP